MVCLDNPHEITARFAGEACCTAFILAMLPSARVSNTVQGDTTLVCLYRTHTHTHTPCHTTPRTHTGFLILTLTVPAEQEPQARALAESITPSAKLSYALGGTLKYELPKDQVGGRARSMSMGGTLEYELPKDQVGGRTRSMSMVGTLEYELPKDQVGGRARSMSMVGTLEYELPKDQVCGRAHSMGRLGRQVCASSAGTCACCAVRSGHRTQEPNHGKGCCCTAG